jgi:hypothetical protein
MSQNFIGENHVAVGYYPLADLWNTGSPNYTPAYNLGLYNHAVFAIMQGVGTAGSATILVQQCTTAAGASPTAIAAKYRLCTTQDTWGALTTLPSTGVVFGVASNQMLLIEVDAADLIATAPTKPYVRLCATVSDATAVLAACIVILTEAAYPQAIPVTAIT